MKEKNKILKKILIILVIVVISLISFGGIFVKEKNRMKNLLPEYQFGMDFNEKRVFSIKPDETINKEYYDSEGNKVESSSIEEGKESEYETKEIPVNSKEILNKENFDKTKKIIEKRLELLGVKEYEIRENSENGEFYISIPENEYADEIISQITTIGDFKITDSEDTEKVLIPGNEVKEAKVGVGTQSGSPIVFLNIQFNKEGTKKLQEISKTYIGEVHEEPEVNQSEDNNTNNEEVADSNNEQNEANNAEENVNKEEEPSTKSKKVNLVLDGQNLLTTYFSKEIKDGLIQLSMGSSSSSTTAEDLQKNVKQASNLAVLLQTEELPIKFVEDTDVYMQSEYNKENIKSFIIIAVVIIIISLIYAIIKYKREGLVLMISQIGFLALLLIVIRFANVIISLTGVVAIILSYIMSYIFILKILKTSKQKEEKVFHKVAYQYFTIYVPALIIAVVFSFIKFLPIASFGMVIFYALMLMILYHGGVTRKLIEKSENK